MRIYIYIFTFYSKTKNSNNKITTEKYIFNEHKLKKYFKNTDFKKLFLYFTKKHLYLLEGIIHFHFLKWYITKRLVNF